MSLLELLRQTGNNYGAPLAVGDPIYPWHPLISINSAFSQLTGYSEKEVIGKSCSFLQGKGTDLNTVSAIKKCLKERTAAFFDLINYKKDGKPFVNRLVLLPLNYDREVYILGLQKDVTSSFVKRPKSASPELLSNDEGQLDHHLRNPLAIALGLLQKQQRKKGSLDSADIDKVKEALQRIRASVDQLPLQPLKNADVFRQTP